MSQAGNGFVFFKILRQELVDARVELNSLLLEVLDLPLKRGVLGAFRRLEAFLGFVELAIEVFISLLLDSQLVLDLRNVALLVLLQTLKLFLQVLQLHVFFPGSLRNLRIQLVCQGLESSASTFLFLHNSCFKLCLFHVLYVFDLRDLLSGLLGGLLKLLGELLFPLLQVLFMGASGLDKLGLGLLSESCL